MGGLLRTGGVGPGRPSEARSLAEVSPSIMVLVLSVDVKYHERKRRESQVRDAKQ